MSRRGRMAPPAPAALQREVAALALGDGAPHSTLGLYCMALRVGMVGLHRALFDLSEVSRARGWLPAARMVRMGGERTLLASYHQNGGSGWLYSVCRDAGLRRARRNLGLGHRVWRVIQITRAAEARARRQEKQLREVEYRESQAGQSA